MARVTARRGLRQTSIEIRSFRGKNHKEHYYLLFKGRGRGANFFEAFIATELKGACIDVLGLPDNQTTRRTDANEFARKVWNG